MNTENHKIIKGCHVAFDSKPSKELESAISEMIDVAREKIESEQISKWKYDQKKKPFENIDSMVEHFNLSDEIKECISQISKQSYISGSNSIYEVYRCKTCGHLPCMCRVPMSF